MTQRSLLALCAIALLCAAPAFSATQGEIRRRISALEVEIERGRDALDDLERSQQGIWTDWRGRREADDQRQYTFSADFYKQLNGLISKARKAPPKEAAGLLDEAESTYVVTKGRAEVIYNYWRHGAAILWRKRWEAFASANGLTGEPANQKLLADDAAMRAGVEQGDFSRALIAATSLEYQVDSYLRTTSSELAKTRKPEDLTLIPRTRPCEADSSGDANGAARITRAASPDLFYPPGAKRREETGGVLVRAFADASGCATQFAVVVSSGFPELDQAAIQVAQNSRYAPATENGVPVAGSVTFVVRFVLRRN